MNENSSVITLRFDGSIQELLLEQKRTNELLEKMLKHQGESPYLNNKEAARYCRVSESTLNRAVEEGLLKPSRQGAKGGKKIFHKMELDEFITFRKQANSNKNLGNQR